MKVGDLVKIGTWGGRHRKEIYVITHDVRELEERDFHYVISQTTGNEVGCVWYVHTDEITALKDTL